MRWGFIAIRFYPYWAVPVGIVFLELARHFRRKNKFNQWPCMGVAGGLFLLVVLWFGFRGDLNSDHWVRALLFQNH